MQRTIHVVILAAFTVVPQMRAQSSAAQPANPPLKYEIVSITANHSGGPGQGMRNLGDGFAFENIPLKNFIALAYDMQQDLISGGPGWVDSEPYDISAKVSGEDVAAYKSLTTAQRIQMLQTVLVERFHLVANTVVKPLPGYVLTISKDGFKLKPLDSQGAGWSVGSYFIRSKGMAVEFLAKNLAGVLRQPVVDKTGISGIYAFDVEWDIASSGTYSPATGSEPSGLPSLPVALQETTGLKLTAAKIPTPTLVIVSIDHPTEN